MMRMRGKGGPLKGLGLLLIAWISLRVATFSAVPNPALPLPDLAGSIQPPGIGVEPVPEGTIAMAPGSGAVSDLPAREVRRSSGMSKRPSRPITGAFLGQARRRTASGAESAASRLYGGEPPQDRLAQCWAEVTASSPPHTQSRWSADGWMLLRRGSGGEAATGLRPASYGASQAGSILRYRLAPGSERRPFAYLRATTTLRGTNEQQAALGFGARPVPRIPVTAAAEVRAVDGPSGTKVQPAAFVVTELAPIPLPAQLQADVYAQAGYVGGAFATPFADGQMRVDRALARLGRINARIGAGAWGGAQKGAARLDVGPAATMWLPLSQSGGARLAIDWRLRVAGDAEPRSGPAVTLSAGF